MSAVLEGRYTGMRPMTPDDLAAVHAIERRAYSHPWTEGILRDCLRVGYYCWLYEEDGEPVGYGILSVAAGEAHVLNLCVDPAHQGHGVGRRVLTHLVNLARRYNADQVLLEVRASNRTAIALYDSLGFNEIGQRRGYYPAADGREDALIFARAL